MIREGLKDWGVGIPEYAPLDLMNREEVQGLGVQAASIILEREGFEIESVNLEPGAHPGIFAWKDGEQWALAFQAKAGQTMVELYYPDRLLLGEFFRKQGLRSGFMEFNCHSMDEERDEADLALYGDQYYFELEQPLMELTNVKQPEKRDEDFPAFRLHLLGRALIFRDLEALRNLLTRDCVYSSHRFPHAVHGREAVIEHLLNFPELQPGMRPGLKWVVRLIGEPPMMPVEHVVMNGQDEGPMMVMNTYREGEPALLINFAGPDGESLAILYASLDGDGCVKKLGLEDTRLFRFEGYWK